MTKLSVRSPITLEAATVIRVAGPGRDTPYALVVARTGDGLVLGRLRGDPQALRIGMELDALEPEAGSPTFAPRRA